MVVAVSVLTLFAAPSAHAVGVRVCVSATNSPLQLWDYSPTADGRDLLEDFGRLDEPGSLAVPNMLTAVNTGGSRIWGWAPLDAQGCTEEFEVDEGVDLQIENYYWSYFPDRNVSTVSLLCPESTADCSTDSLTTMEAVPPGGGTINVELGTSRRAYVHFAAATSEARVPTRINASFYTRTGIELGTVSNFSAGGKPTSNLGGDAFRRKFTVAHEYGHLKTTLDLIPAFSVTDTDYCYGDPADCTATWGATSPEWQSAAAVEGFADFHAMIVWNDPQGTLRDAVRAWSATATSWRCRYRPDPLDVDPALPDACESADPNVTVIADSWHYQRNCAPEACEPGVAVSSDWAWALWDMLLFSNVSQSEILSMLSFAHPWPVNGADDDYWDNFVQGVTGPILAGEDLGDWFGASEIRGIDD